MEKQKRRRDPLEANNSASDELEAVMKRRRLAAGGIENHNPEQQVVLSPARSRHLESKVKSDMPTIASVQLRVQQLAQRQEGLSSSSPRDMCHIGEEEFRSRLEQFKTPSPIPKTSSIPATPSTCQRSRFVQNMQQQLNTTVTSSAKEVSRLRQARKEEVKSLKMQPLTENMWLKRSFSDPSLSEDDSSIELNRSKYCLNLIGMNETMEDSVIGMSTCSADIQPPATVLCPSEPEVCPDEEISTTALIDEMFEGVLQAGTVEEETRDNEHSVSEREKGDDMQTTNPQPSVKSPGCSPGVDDGACVGEQNECEKPNEKDETAGEVDESAVCNEDDFLSLPPSCVLSPLSKSVESMIMPMFSTAVSPPMELCDPPEEVAMPSAAPLYSIESYRSQIQNPPSSQGATPGVQKPCADKSDLKSNPINTKETIQMLSEEVTKLQTVIQQTIQAMSCCSDEEHGKGSLQEAEAEKLLLVSSEKHMALLAEIGRLREGGGGREPHSDCLQPCRGTVKISNIQLPLKMEFVLSARTARPSHYFFVLIRYGAYNMVATPLATAADAENGDTITFPTTITLQDTRSNFEIDVEVYSLCNSATNSSSSNVQQNRTFIKPKVTPKKILGSIKKSNLRSNSGTSPALNPRRSSNFSLVGSHKISLSSLGQSKFLLDKMKFEGKIRQLLGDEFQEKVPFLSPLEGHIYLQLHSTSHSNVHHQGFLTMLEEVGGFIAWQRLFIKLEGGVLYYWTHPNKMGSMPAEGSIPLCRFDSVRLVGRDSCARPHTFQLVNSRSLQQDHSHILTNLFAADTCEEQTDWMEKLNQVLLDLCTWNQEVAGGESGGVNVSLITTTSRESVL